MASDHWPTYVLLALYILAMFVVTIVARVQNSAERKAADSSKSSITTHFLASKNFGALILLFTTFASVFSGYTVVGVPNEAGVNGFSAIRWISGVLFVAAGLLMIFPRLRRISILRSYDSPGQFIGDRFGSTPLSVLTAICLCAPQLLYISIQLHSLGLTLSFLTDEELDYYVVVIVSALLILIFEAIGGMRSVAYTDAVQASIMVLCFFAIPIVLAVQYGGFTGQVVNSDELPCENSNKDETSGCLNYSKTAADIDEFYLRFPSSLTTINYLLFSVSLLSFALNPHVLQRAMAARHDWQLKFVIICMFIAGFLCMTPGLLMGITWQSNLTEFMAEYPGFPAFQATLGILRDEGGFVAFLAYMALLAALAGIMSTADSALIGVSNTISCDIFEKWLTPNLRKTHIVWIGKLISICTMGFSIALASYINESGVSYAAILTLQQGILWQAFPAYVLGLYTDISYKSVLFGMSIGVVLDVILISLAFGGSDPFKEADPNLQILDKAWSSLIGAAANVLVCGVCHLFVFQNKNYSDISENDTLHIQEIRRIMKGIREPITAYYGVFVHLSTILCVIAAFHWIGGGVDPELKERFGDDVYALLYNGKVAEVIGGFPEWSFASMMWYVVATGCGLFATWIWTTDLEYEQSQSVPTQSGVALQDLNDNDTHAGNVVVERETGRTSGTDTNEGVDV